MRADDLIFVFIVRRDKTNLLPVIIYMAFKLYQQQLELSFDIFDKT